MRVRKQADANNFTDYIYFGSQVIAERQVIGGGAAAWTDYIFAGGKRIAKAPGVIATTGTEYYHSDHLGSARLMTNNSGTVVSGSEGTFLPYGQEYSATTNSNHYKFTGKERDAESGLDYFGARYYGSSAGRFTTADPFNPILRFSKRSQFDIYLSQPQNWNAYTYTWNNPLRFTDPSGESVYVVLYTTGNSKGDEELKRAAETKAAAIRNTRGFDPKNDTVLLRAVKTKQDVANAFRDANALGETYGTVQQLSMYSHSGARDGPTLHGGPVTALSPHGGTQFSSKELKSLPALNWAPNANAMFYGCNTSKFAGAFATAQNVTSFGTTGSAYFSSRPDRLSDDSGGSLFLIDTYFNWRLAPNFINYAASMKQHDPD